MEYAFRVTEYLKGEIAEKPNGVLAKQFMPSAEELVQGPLDMTDPIGDEAHSPCAGIVHRYRDRALFLVAVSCAAYCRYCFRKEMVGRTKPLSRAEVEQALDYLKAHPEIQEVILTGGDPLVLSDAKLAQCFDDLLSIESLKLIRIHTRLPLVEPQRITEELLHTLKKVQQSSKALNVVIHCNHAEELTSEVKTALRRLREGGINLLSQSVLLKEINDSTQDLENLFRELLYLGVKPYYLHHLDRAPGSEHFRVSLKKGMELVRGLRGGLTGLALPNYVLDIPGGYGKIPVNSDYIKEVEPGHYELLDPKGQVHQYRDQQ